MVLFPWLIAILLLVIIAQVVLMAIGSTAGSVRERRMHVRRPERRAIVALVLVELVVLLAWGLMLRPR
jgi:hypothetical protein